MEQKKQEEKKERVEPKEDKTKVHCECGVYITKNKLDKHLGTLTHFKNMKLKV